MSVGAPTKARMNAHGPRPAYAADAVAIRVNNPRNAMASWAEASRCWPIKVMMPIAAGNAAPARTNTKTTEGRTAAVARVPPPTHSSHGSRKADTVPTAAISNPITVRATNASRTHRAHLVEVITRVCGGNSGDERPTDAQVEQRQDHPQREERSNEAELLLRECLGSDPERDNRHGGVDDPDGDIGHHAAQNGRVALLAASGLGCAHQPLRASHSGA